MLFPLILKFIWIPLVIIILLWYIWPKTKQKIEQIEAGRQPDIEKADEMAKKNKKFSSKKK